MSSERLSHPVALVTGAGGGIGAETAAALAAAGFHVVLAGRTRTALDTVARRIGGDAASAITADVADPAAVRALFDAVATRHGRLDFLFNNAGVALPPTDIEDVGYEAWRRVIDTCLTGAFLCTQAAFGLMKTQAPSGGRILNNGSVASQSPRPRAAAYTAAKTGLTGLTRSSALDGRRFGIAVGQIDIGNADTAMAAGQVEGIEQADGSIRAEAAIDPAVVGRAVARIALLPLDVNVPSVTLMPTRMPLIGRG